MKIALIGYGKMGKLIETVAAAKGHTVVGRVNQTNRMSKQTIGDADVCIDFSHPDSLVNNLQGCASLGKNVVIGTTGWDNNKQLVENIIREHNIGCIYAANFSIGVNLFMHIVANAAKLIDSFDDYDVAGIEYHHKHKVDSPSGTAKYLTEVLLKNAPRKKRCDFSSVRCGSIPGIHTIVFDSPADTITLTHEARSREGFAKGAVAAAEWIRGKRGLFTIEDLLGIATVSQLPQAISRKERKGASAKNAKKGH